MSTVNSYSLSVGINVVPLLTLNFSTEMKVWFDSGTEGGNFQFFGILDSTTSSAAQNVVPLADFSVQPGAVEMPANILGAFQGWPLLLVVSDSVATLLVSGNAPPGATSVASVVTPTGTNYSTLMDLTAYSTSGARIMGSKTMTSADQLLVYGTNDETADPASTGTDGAVLLGSVFGGGAPGASLISKGWGYCFFQREPSSSGTTAGHMLAAGVTAPNGNGQGTALLQGGQAFGGPVQVGATDNQPVQVIANNALVAEFNPDGSLQIGGSLAPGELSIADVSAGGNIGTAPNTVDKASVFLINQTTVEKDLALPAPGSHNSGQLSCMANVGTAVFTAYGAVVRPLTALWLIWDQNAPLGGAWLPQTVAPMMTKVTTKTGAYTPNFNETVPTDCSGANVPITLPVITPGSAGAFILVSVVASPANVFTGGTVTTVQAGTANTIGGATTPSLMRLSGVSTLLLQSDGNTNWLIVSQSGGPAVGPALTSGASSPARLGQNTLYILPAGTLAADSGCQPVTASAKAGDLMTIVRLDTSRFGFNIIAAVTFALPAGTQSAATLWFDGTAWQPMSVGSVGPFVQSGTVTLTTTGASNLVPATVTASTRVTVTPTAFAGSGVGTTDTYAVLSKTVGNLGSGGGFVVSAVNTAKTLNANDTSTLDWIAVG